MCNRTLAIDNFEQPAFPNASNVCWRHNHNFFHTLDPASTYFTDAVQLLG